MKKPALLLASLFAFTALTPLAAEAGGRDRDGGRGGYSRSSHHGHHHSERPVRMVKVCVGHARDGCPIYRWVPAPARHHGGGYSRGGYDRSDDRYDRHDRRSSRSRNGITIRIGG